MVPIVFVSKSASMVSFLQRMEIPSILIPIHYTKDRKGTCYVNKSCWRTKLRCYSVNRISTSKVVTAEIRNRIFIANITGNGHALSPF